MSTVSNPAAIPRRATLTFLALAVVAASLVSTAAASAGDAETQPILRRARVEPILVSYPKAGLLHNYQFLSPGLLLALIVFGVLVGPLVLFIVARLSEVSTPDRLGVEPRKAPASDKKAQ
ncbi:hypothetical protein V8E36_000568 [Tilletia maclaganii]